MGRYLFLLFLFPLGASEITMGRAAELLQAWEPGATLPEIADPELPLTAMAAARFLWVNSTVSRRRFWSFLNWDGGLWEEAMERGWFHPETLPETGMDEASFQAAYRRSREETQLWIRDSVPRWWDWSLTLKLRSGLGPPFAQGLFFQGWNLLGLSLGGTEHGIVVEGGTFYDWREDGNPVFVPYIERLLYTVAISPQASWYRTLALDLGRFVQTDGSGLVYSQVLDGGRLRLVGEDFILALQTGFAGFIDKQRGVPLLTPGDITDFFNGENTFGPPRLLSALTFLHQPFHWLDWSAAAVFHSDFRDRVTPARVVYSGATLYTPLEGGLYSGTVLSLGAVFLPEPWFTLRVSGAFQTAESLSYLSSEGEYRATSVNALAASSQGIWKWDSVKAGFKIFFSSGDGSDRESFMEGSRFFNGAYSSGLFKSWGVAGPGSFYKLDWGNIMGGGGFADWHLSLFSVSHLKLTTSVQTFFRPLSGPVSDSAVVSGTEASLYLGTEAYLGMEWNPWAETYLKLNSGLFVPNRNGAYPESSDALVWGVSLDAGWQF